MSGKPLQLTSYFWPGDIEPCATFATLESICPFPGHSFAVVYELLKMANLNFTVNMFDWNASNMTVVGNHTYYNYEIAVIEGNAVLVPYLDSINKLIPFLSYLTLPTFFSRPALLVHPERHPVRLPIMDPFSKKVWLLGSILICIQSLLFSTLINGYKNSFCIWVSNWTGWIFKFHFSRIGYAKAHQTLNYVRLHLVWYSLCAATGMMLYKKEFIRHFTPTLTPALPPDNMIELLNDYENVDNSQLFRIFWNYYPDVVSSDASLNERLHHILDTKFRNEQVKVYDEMFLSVAENPKSLAFTYFHQAAFYRRKFPHLCVVSLKDLPVLRYGIGISMGLRVAQERLTRAGDEAYQFGLWHRQIRLTENAFGETENEGCSTNPQLATTGLARLPLYLFFKSTKIQVYGFSIALGILIVEATWKHMIKVLN